MNEGLYGRGAGSFSSAIGYGMRLLERLGRLLIIAESGGRHQNRFLKSAWNCPRRDRGFRLDVGDLEDPLDLDRHAEVHLLHAGMTPCHSHTHPHTSGTVPECWQCAWWRRPSRRTLWIGRVRVAPRRRAPAHLVGTGGEAPC